MHGPPNINGPPIKDAHDDWELIEAREDQTKTYLKFSRDLNTCDTEDYPISVSKLFKQRENLTFKGFLAIFLGFRMTLCASFGLWVQQTILCTMKLTEAPRVLI